MPRRDDPVAAERGAAERGAAERGAAERGAAEQVSFGGPSKAAAAASPAPERPGLARRLGAPLRWAIIRAVRLYQITLSPLIPFHCRFRPTCSQYFIEAVERHGAVKGSLLGFWRLLRCQPLCRGGFDPVP